MDNYFNMQSRRKQSQQASKEKCTKNVEHYYVAKFKLQHNHSHDNVERRRQDILGQRREKAMIWSNKMMQRHAEKLRREQEKKKQISQGLEKKTKNESR